MEEKEMGSVNMSGLSHTGTQMMFCLPLLLSSMAGSMATDCS